jgi:hypothetical protein
MLTPLAIRAPLTVAFVVVAVYCAARCVTPAPGSGPHGWTQRLSDLAHLTMSALMVATLWALFGPDRWGWQLSVCAVAVGWFAVRALRAPGGPAHPVRWGFVHQAVTMAAMFWMTWSMSAPPMAMVAHPVPAAGVPVVLAGYLTLATLWWIVRSRRSALAGASLRCTAFGAAGDAACQALMTGAMSVVLIGLV